MHDGPHHRQSGGTGGAHNLFFGLFPDDATRRRLGAAVESLRAEQPAGRWLKPDRYHLTLHFIGHFAHIDADLLARTCRAAGTVRAPAFELLLDEAGGFPRNRVGWLGCSQDSGPLQRLWDELRGALAQEGVKPDGHPDFKAHVTVLRDAAHGLSHRPIDPVPWPVHEFLLIDSDLGQRGGYTPCGRWTLDAGSHA